MSITREKIEHALEILGLPRLVTKAEIKQQYRFLAKKYHPDRTKKCQNMEQINEAYATLMKYIEEFRYTFDEDEIRKQFPEVDYVQHYRA